MFGLFAKRPAGRRGSSRPLGCVLRCEELEPRAVPAGMFVAGVGGATQAADPEVSLYATAGPRANQRLGSQLEAFSTTFGDTRIALGDVNGDGTDDIIAAAGKGGGSAVKIFDGAAAVRGIQSVLASFFVYSDQPGVSQNRGFDGGVFVAAADLNGDGFAELITTPGLGGRGHLKVLDFNNNGTFLGSAPARRASAYTFTDYNGEIRVATLQTLSKTYVVTASGAGVAGDVRVYEGVYNLGDVQDRTPVPATFLKARLVPFGGYTGGLSVAAGDSNAGGADELFVSKNDGPARVEVYTAVGVFDAFAAGNVGPSPLATFEAFAGFNGEVRLGAADVDGDGKVEVLTTTGFSGDPQGTPVKAWAQAGSSFNLVRSFYSNPGYLPGAWLGGKDFNFAQDLTSFRVGDNNVYAALPATFESNPDLVSYRNFEDVGVGFPDLPGGGAALPAETVTGAAVGFHDVEVTLAFDHSFPAEVTVRLVYAPGGGAAERALTLYSGPSHPGRAGGRPRVTFTDAAAGTIPDNTSNVFTGRFKADGGSLRTFVQSLPNRTGVFLITFEDSVAFASGTVPASPAPKLRLLY